MVLLAGFGLVGSLCAQQGTTAPSGSATIAPTPEFLATTDEVINEMSEITGWKLKTPLKRSIRTREEIHAYVLREMDDEKDAKERYASAKSAEAFGLIPKNFDLDHFMVDLLTEQIAGLYDPKQHEFYIADWIAPDDHGRGHYRSLDRLRHKTAFYSMAARRGQTHLGRASSRSRRKSIR